MATQTSRKRAERPAIVRKPGIRGAAPTIEGTGIRVSDIVNQRRLDHSLRRIQQAYPHLTVAQIRAALSFYTQNKDEIDDYIKEEEALASAHRGRQTFT